MAAALQHLVRTLGQQRIVGTDIRLAFHAVQNQCLNAGSRIELGRSGKQGATHSNDAGLHDVVADLRRR